MVQYKREIIAMLKISCITMYKPPSFMLRRNYQVKYVSDQPWEMSIMLKHKNIDKLQLNITKKEMTDSVRMTVAYMAQGLRDSILGTFRVYQLDKLDHANKEKQEETKEEPMSTLARRRAERMKHRPAKTDR